MAFCEVILVPTIYGMVSDALYHVRRGDDKVKKLSAHCTALLVFIIVDNI